MNFTLNGRILKYVNEECIFIYRNDGVWKKNPKWCEVSICNGIYKYLRIGNRKYYLHRIIAYLFLGLDIEDTKQVIDHINCNKQNNKIENLRIATHQENSHNNFKHKGYVMRYNGRFLAKIYMCGSWIYLGTYDTEEEAHQSYLDGKKIYHSFSNNSTILQ